MSEQIKAIDVAQERWPRLKWHEDRRGPCHAVIAKDPETEVCLSVRTTHDGVFVIFVESFGTRGLERCEFGVGLTLDAAEIDLRREIERYAPLGAINRALPFLRSPH